MLSVPNSSPSYFPFHIHSGFCDSGLCEVGGFCDSGPGEVEWPWSWCCRNVQRERERERERERFLLLGVKN